MEDSIKESGQDMLNRLLKKIREEGESRSVYELGNPAMIAGTFDYLRLESLIMICSAKQQVLIIISAC